ncbi:MAG TPA: Qat anti-phage system associated protein QatB [Fimbriimonadaceae bacterium]|nr:Qat anti-phage system associated protein QatB [Fimbriimonadaceae bacterium]
MPPPAPVDPKRFTQARASLSRFASSGGTSRRSFGKAVADYVSRSSGGSGGAARRMGSSRATAGKLLGFLADAQARGLTAALEAVSLGSLIGKPMESIFFGLADVLCPSDGSVDSSIARDAFTETIIEMVDAGIASFDALTEGQVRLILESFVSNTILDRLYADIGAGVVRLAQSAKEVAFIQVQIRDYIRGAVRDACDSRNADFRGLSQADAKRVSTEVYGQAFAILSQYGDGGSA